MECLRSFSFEPTGKMGTQFEFPFFFLLVSCGGGSSPPPNQGTGNTQENTDQGSIKNTKKSISLDNNNYSQAEERINALTHGLGTLFSCLALYLLLQKASLYL